jgi:hypothetical protein
MKVKIFKGDVSKSDALEEMIDEFLANKEVKLISQSIEASTYTSSPLLVISVWYEPTGKAPISGREHLSHLKVV